MSTPSFNSANFDFWRNNVGILTSILGLCPTWSTEDPPKYVDVFSHESARTLNFQRKALVRIGDRITWVIYEPIAGQINIPPAIEIYIQNS